jgi:D-alanyl-D-alanine dipeptidase
MEGGTRVIWNNTAANLQTNANSLVRLIQGAGGTAAITSAYRPQAYQSHLREVWDKARTLQSHPETACDTVRAAVNAEMANHSLDVNRPVAQISNHRAGNAVDISWTLPAALTHALCQLPVPDGGTPAPPTEEHCIDNLAAQAGLSHPLHAGDRPHFEV